MTIAQRAASFAAVTLMFVGLIGAGSPGLASAMDRTPVTTAAITTAATLNAAVATTVPTGRPVITPDMMVQPLPAEDGAEQSVTDDDNDQSYASLAAAVAAQDVSDDASGDLACLAGAIYYESKGEPLSGQLAVAEVIINRTKSGRFPASLCGVVKQPGQFSFVRGGTIPDIDQNRASYRTALAVARIAMADGWDNPAPDALFFHARRISAGWNKTKVAAIGNHIFYR